MAADHDRRMWALAWLRLEADAIEGGVAPLEARQLLGPEDADRLQVLVGDGAAVLERDAERAELRLDVAAPEAGDEPPAGDQVERRERLREQHGVVVREDEDRSEEHTSELQSPCNLVCRLLLEKKKMNTI